MTHKYAQMPAFDPDLAIVFKNGKRRKRTGVRLSVSR
jgi:hypothetical protein